MVVVVFVGGESMGCTWSKKTKSCQEAAMECADRGTPAPGNASVIGQMVPAQSEQSWLDWFEVQTRTCMDPGVGVGEDLSARSEVPSEIPSEVSPEEWYRQEALDRDGTFISPDLDISHDGSNEIEPILFDQWEGDDFYGEDGGWVEPSPEAVEQMSDADRHGYETLKREYLKEFELLKYEREMEGYEGGRDAWERANPVKALRYEKGTSAPADDSP